MRRKKLAVEQGETETCVVTRDAYDMLRKEAEEGKLATERYNNLIVRLKENERVLKTITDERDKLKTENDTLKEKNAQFSKGVIDLNDMLHKARIERDSYKEHFEGALERINKTQSDHDFQTARLEEAHRAFDKLCQALTR